VDQCLLVSRAIEHQLEIAAVVIPDLAEGPYFCSPGFSLDFEVHKVIANIHLFDSRRVMFFPQLRWI
jgi:hypothetical protein